MFGLSFGKFLILVAVVLAVWYGFRYLSRLDQIRQKRARPVDREAEPPRTEARTATQIPTEDLIKCPVCATYVPARRTVSCGQPSCPY